MERKSEVPAKLTRRPRGDLKSIATQVLSSAGALSPPELKSLADSLHALRSAGHAGDPHRVHGERASNLFSHIVASLGAASLVKEEDAGEVICSNPVQPPDWRVVLRDGRQFLVEVKNCHLPEVKNGSSFSLRENDIALLENYGLAVGVPLLIAIYWSGQRMWSLLPVAALKPRAGDATRRAVTFLDACSKNEMSLMGDLFVASAGPIHFRVGVTELSTSDACDVKRTTVDINGVAHTLKIRHVALFCGTRRLESRSAQALASYLVMHGSWREETSLMRNNAGQLDAVDFAFSPDPELSDDPMPVFDGAPAACAIHGSLSSMMSHEFVTRTTRAEPASNRRKVVALRLPEQSSRLGCDLPAETKASELPLAIMTVLVKDQSNLPIDRSADFAD